MFAPNREDCIAAGDAMLANAAMPALLTAVVDQGWLVLNGEDLAVSADLVGTSHNRLLVTMGLESPTIEHHLQHSRNLAWLADNRLVVAIQGEAVRAGLSVRNSLRRSMAMRISWFSMRSWPPRLLASWVSVRAPSGGDLPDLVSDPDFTPGSFNILSTGNSMLILDQPSASWFLRPVLRALRDYHRARLLTVFSGLRGTMREDTAEIGRLLGRISNILIVSDDESDDAERIALAMEGARENAVPPMLIPVTSEVDGGAPGDGVGAAAAM